MFQLLICVSFDKIISKKNINGMKSFLMTHDHSRRYKNNLCQNNLKIMTPNGGTNIYEINGGVIVVSIITQKMNEV